VREWGIGGGAKSCLRDAIRKPGFVGGGVCKGGEESRGRGGMGGGWGREGVSLSQEYGLGSWEGKGRSQKENFEWGAYSEGVGRLGK